MSGRRWCVVQTRPREEQVAISNLGNQSFEVFMPLLREAGRTGTRLVAMFPGYLFVAIDPATSAWLSIASTRGVKRLITSRPDRPAFVPTGWVEELRSRGIVDAFTDALSFSKGDKVELIAGPFEGNIAVCKWTSERRIGVLFDCMGRESMLICEPKMLRLVKDKHPHAVR